MGTGVFSIVFFSYCYFRNVEISSAAFASILMYTFPVWVTLLSMFFFKEKMNGRKWIALLMALAMAFLTTALSFSLYTLGLRHMEPGRAAVLATLEPIITALAGSVVYNETLTVMTVSGIGLVLAASVLIARS